MKTTQALKTAVKGNVRLQIFPDEMDESPREWDNLGTMVCFHRRYNLGDKHDFTPETISAYVKRTDVVALPVFMYDHSGLSLSTGREYPFDDRWDSMQVGFIYCTLEKAKKEFGDIPNLAAKVRDILQGEVDTYSQYLSGEVYGFVLEQKHTCKECNTEKWEHIDSCWGFYAIEDMREHVSDEYKELFDLLQ